MSLAVESCHADSSHVRSLGDHARTPPRRGVGPHSKLVLYESLIGQWLREDPDLSSAKVLSRVRLAGYQGGKSALYELVRRLRLLDSG